MKWEAPPAKVQVGRVRRWLGSSLEALDCILSAIERKRVKDRIVDHHSLDWVPGDHLSGVAVDALLPFIAVLDHEEIVRQAALAMSERMTAGIVVEAFESASRRGYGCEGKMAA